MTASHNKLPMYINDPLSDQKNTSRFMAGKFIETNARENAADQVIVATCV